MPHIHYFSKSHYLEFLQCPKLLWHRFNDPSAIAPHDPVTAHRLREGQLVENAARELLGDGLLIDHQRDFESILAESTHVLHVPPVNTPIYQALVCHEKLVAEVDCLFPEENGFDIYEVKSSTEIKPHHISDVAFQRHVAGMSGLNGLKIRKCFLLNIDNHYVRHGEIDYSKLFSITDITEQVDAELPGVEKNVKKAMEVIAADKCPDVPIGLQCDDPEPCPLKSICWREVNEEPGNVFSLYRLHRKKAFGLYRQGVLKLTDLPTGFKLSDKQRIQVEVETTGKPHIDEKAVRELINRLESPVHFLDFETFQCAIPVFDNTKPYQQIPFQFSLHISRGNLDEEPEHHGWIWNGQGDPREEMLRRLKDLPGNEGSIVVYNQSFEVGRLKEAAEVYPEYLQWVEDLLPRFVDLLQLFRSFAVYFPGQRGSASMKSVLPAVTGQDYGEFEIRDGQTASVEFMRVMMEDADEQERQKVLRELERYCGMDTMGMVMIVRELRGKIWPRNAGSSAKP